MADDVAAPEEVSDSTTHQEQPEPAKVGETTGAAGEAGDQDKAAPDVQEEAGEAHDTEQETPAKPQMSKVRLAIVAGLVVVVALAALAGWVGFRAYNSYQADQQRKLYVQVARQGALNLTTIDWHQADADIQRILNSSTGTFYDDFQRRAQPFIEVVKHFQSKSEGTITAAALESESDDQAQVLLAVTVRTSTADAVEQRPRAWRMRITVKKLGDEAKVANVEFVP
ncbi:Mce protein [Mycobacterium decipiens]|uniref:Mce protein n=1 Tax=Mycobacterium decipiens TaxID=1430326 RepID=A0A1X2LVJ1_9MYCO|nr:Mce protein [Mycobacterium decipiens]OSC41117.1 Mce protein [Mycobacterium decipiens]